MKFWNLWWVRIVVDLAIILAGLVLVTVYRAYLPGISPIQLLLSLLIFLIKRQPFPPPMDFFFPVGFYIPRRQ